MIRKIQYLYFFILTINVSLAGQSEAYYINVINEKLGGITEKSVYGGRVDIVTNEYAIEVERASKWKNAIGQALWYGLQTNKKPGIVLLILDKSEYKYGIMLQSALDYAGLHDKIKVWFYPKDFEEKESNNYYEFLQNDNFGDNNAKTSNTINSDDKTNYWLSRNSKVRHNSSCRWYMRSKGRFCGPDEGRPCKLCGG